MFYQVRATMFFATVDEANDFYHDCQVALPKAVVVNPGQDSQECSRMELLVCHHDDLPNNPCDLIHSADNHPEPPS